MPGCRHLQGVPVPAAQKRTDCLHLPSSPHTPIAIAAKVHKFLWLACRLMYARLSVSL